MITYRYILIVIFSFYTAAYAPPVRSKDRDKIKEMAISDRSFCLREKEKKQARDQQLLQSVCQGHEQNVQILLSQEADPHATDCNGYHALALAARYNRPAIAEILQYKGGASLSQSCGPMGGTALHEASGCGHIRVVRALLRFMHEPNDINALDYYHYTPLMYASNAGKVVIVGALLKKGARTEIKDLHGRTALTWAFLNGHLLVAQELIAHGATMQEVDPAKLDNKDLKQRLLQWKQEFPQQTVEEDRDICMEE